VSSEIDLGRSLLATGFPYDLRDRAEGLLARFSRLVRTAQGVRRAGAAALDLAWVAAGRLDGYWEEGLWPWDTGAGSLIVEEAGGRVTDFKGTTWDPWKKEVLASNGRIHYNMVEML
jgi:myo-inositol-1(or 4)-monophosphatase